MLTPFQAHAELMGQYQAFIGGGKRTGLGTLTFTSFPQLRPIVPVTHTGVVYDFQVTFGLSAKTFVERCEILASDVSFIPTKGMFVTLTLNASGLAYPMRIWRGGPQEGGLIYRFELVDAAFNF